MISVEQFTYVPFEDEAEKNLLKGAFEQFKQRNSQIITGKKIIPDSIYSKYTLK